MGAPQSDHKIHPVLWVEIQQNGLAVAFIQPGHGFYVRLGFDDRGARQFPYDELPQTLSHNWVSIDYQNHRHRARHFVKDQVIAIGLPDGSNAIAPRPGFTANNGPLREPQVQAPIFASSGPHRKHNLRVMWRNAGPD
jgi:hypothetical protein